jgi:hypothetical protein
MPFEIEIVVKSLTNSHWKGASRFGEWVLPILMPELLVR